MLSLEKIYTACNGGQPYNTTYYRPASNYLLVGKNHSFYELGASKTFTLDRTKYYTYDVHNGTPITNIELDDSNPMAIIPRGDMRKIIEPRLNTDNLAHDIRTHTWMRQKLMKEKEKI